MIELGKRQKLFIINTTDFGVYLNDEVGKKDGSILLPKKQVPKNSKVGDEIEVFVYRDSSDRLIATTNIPYLSVGEKAMLRVVQITKIGAFLDWGLEKDLLLPFKEQTTEVKEGKEYLVSLYIDKSERLCATMKLYTLLETDSPYKKNDLVKGHVYEINKRFGVFVAVDDKYMGMIPKAELFQKLHVGDEIQTRVLKVREDGKLDLSTRQKAYRQMDKDSEYILQKIRENGGFLPLHDKSDPEIIQEKLEMSKNAFKRAVGRLWKEHKITILENGIEIVEK
ncbi:MAG: S1 RNA-binding domain-containing protein [Lachnospiraceae bacterium]